MPFFLTTKKVPSVVKLTLMKFQEALKFSQHLLLCLIWHLAGGKQNCIYGILEQTNNNHCLSSNVTYA
jgi:hypothetical protein